ncbi:MAG: sulfatase family protein, partial [Planctomycetota bacterium]
MNTDSNVASLNRRNFLKAVGVSLLTAAPAWGNSNRPNVLLLFSDQHHAGAMACAGHPIVKTPTMDRLAANGIRFSRAYCQDGICVPSRTSMMTGLYPRTTGCLDNPNNPVEPDRYIMLQKLFKLNGYTTGCFGKRHLPKNEMALGWDYSATTINPKLDPSDENYYDWLKENGLYEKYRMAAGKAIMDSNLFCRISKLRAEQRDAAYTADKTVAFLKNCKANDKPFFCWASFHGPHQPYTPPRKWADMYKPEEMTLPPNVDEPVENLPHELQDWRKNKKRPWNLGTAAENKDLYRTFLAYYYAQVTEVDHYMGVILEQLNRLGLAENTIIIYASDHGDFTAHHGMTEKCALGHNIYEDTLRIPLIISWPARFAKNIVCDSLVELLDFYPTLIDLLNLKIPAKIQDLAGISLKPALIQGKEVRRKYAFSENWSQLTVIGKRYKLGTWIDPGPLPRYKIRDNRKRNPDMLFDLQDDPLETVNQIDNPQFAEIKRELHNTMQQWIA